MTRHVFAARLLAAAALPALAALGTALPGTMGVAQAQQSGLFPLHPIKRERVPCPLEDPIYKQYRTQYYGYYPTQWRPFPQGCNMASPEGPHTREALQKQPIEASALPRELLPLVDATNQVMERLQILTALASAGRAAPEISSAPSRSFMVARRCRRTASSSPDPRASASAL